MEATWLCITGLINARSADAVMVADDSIRYCRDRTGINSRAQRRMSAEADSMVLSRRDIRRSAPDIVSGASRGRFPNGHRNHRRVLNALQSDQMRSAIARS